MPPTARRSLGEGRTGITTRSTSAITSVMVSERDGGVSISRTPYPAASAALTAACSPCAGSIQRGVSALRAFHQPARPPCGSASMTATGPTSAASAATARCAESVVSPDPPLREAIPMTRMAA